MVNPSDNSLFPLSGLKSPAIVYGPDGEEMTLRDSRVDEFGIQRCTRCRRVKLLTEFYLQNGKPQSECKECRKVIIGEYARRPEVLARRREKYQNDPELQERQRDYNQQRMMDPEFRARNREKTRRWQEEHPGYHRANNLKKYNLTPDQFDEILATQDGVCALCRMPSDRRALDVDHDHLCCPGSGSCGKCIRSLLCSPCNLKYFRGDDPLSLLKFTVYVLWWRREHGKASDDDLVLFKELQGLLSNRGEDAEWLDKMYLELGPRVVPSFVELDEGASPVGGGVGLPVQHLFDSEVVEVAELGPVGDFDDFSDVAADE